MTDTAMYKGEPVECLGEKMDPKKGHMILVVTNGRKRWVKAENVMKQTPETPSPTPPSAPKEAKRAVFTALGTYATRVGPYTPAVVMFDEVTPWRDPDGKLLGPQWNLHIGRRGASATKDGVAIGQGMALMLGLKPGDPVKVTVEKV